MENHFSSLLGSKMLRIADVQKNTGVSRGVLTDLYYKKAENPSLSTLIKICDFLQVPLSELVEYDPTEKS